MSAEIHDVVAAYTQAGPDAFKRLVRRLTDVPDHQERSRLFSEVVRKEGLSPDEAERLAGEALRKIVPPGDVVDFARERKKRSSGGTEKTDLRALVLGNLTPAALLVLAEKFLPNEMTTAMARDILAEEPATVAAILDAVRQDEWTLDDVGGLLGLIAADGREDGRRFTEAVLAGLNEREHAVVAKAQRRRWASCLTLFSRLTPTGISVAGR